MTMDIIRSIIHPSTCHPTSSRGGQLCSLHDVFDVKNPMHFMYLNKVMMKSMQAFSASKFGELLGPAQALSLRPPTRCSIDADSSTGATCVLGLRLPCLGLAGVLY